jgi:N-acetylglucosaminyldiphosphoundecaprenol N-acetyl-beta-D-mannosaminyltransferase
MPRIRIMDVQFDNVTMPEALERVSGMVSRREGAYVVTPNSEMVYACRGDAGLCAAIAGASLTVPDGVGILHAARILKTPLRERVPGIELGEGLAAWMSTHRRRLFLLGAKPGIAERAADYLKQHYPGLIIAGTHDGYFTDEGAVLAEIADAKPDAMFVCLGFPKQEQFMARNRAALPHIVMLGIGGSLDAWAGVVPRAPKFYREHGMEWFYRLIKQPRRIGRMINLPRFLWQVVLLRYGNKRVT